MIGPIFCENITRQRFSSPKIRECTDTSSATKMLSCDRESFSGVLSVKSVRPALTRTKTNPSLSLSSRTSYSQHISPSPHRRGFFVRRKSEQLHKRPTSKGQSGRRIFPAGCIHEKHTFVLKNIMEIQRGVHCFLILALDRGAKSSFCVHQALVLYLHSHTNFL